MQVETINIKVGRMINVGDQETRSIEVGMEITLANGDNVEQQYHSLKSSLEHDTRIKAAGGTFEDITAPPPLIPANISQNNSLSKNPTLKRKEVKQKFEKSREPISTTQLSEAYTCPECNEPMKQKEGKEYFLCSKHWGYPNQITRGIVKERKF